MIGVILAGGNSTRFGEDKSLYVLDNQKMFEHVANSLMKSNICDKIVISTNVRLQHEFGNFETIVDDPNFKEHGPLTGIYSVIKKYEDEPLLVVSTDTPYVPHTWFQKLKNEYDIKKHTIITEGAQLHPLIGIYRDKDMVQKLHQQLESKRLSIRQFLKQLDYSVLNIETLDLNESDFRNINHKSDIE